MSRALPSILGVTSLVIAGSCARSVPPRAVDPAAAAAFLNSVGKRFAPGTGYVASGEMTYLDEAQRFRGQLNVAVQWPDRFRLELLAPNGQLLHAILSNGAEIVRFSSRENLYQYGPVSRNVLAEWVPVAPPGLSARDFVGLFFGAVEIPTGAELSVQGKHVSASWHVDDHDVEARFQEPAARLEILALSGSSTPESRILFESYEGVYPDRLLVEIGAAQRIRLDLSEHDGSVALTPADFWLDPPDGARIERL